jgi:hypothetical protein
MTALAVIAQQSNSTTALAVSVSVALAVAGPVLWASLNSNSMTALAVAAAVVVPVTEIARQLLLVTAHDSSSCRYYSCCRWSCLVLVTVQ